MRSAITLALLLLANGSAAQENLRQKKNTAESGLKKGSSIAPDRSLAGDLTRKKEEREAVPALHYDQFRLGVELQVASKRHEQIESLTKILRLAPDQRELPGLLFRLGELYWEESKFFFFEANRKDDEVIRAINRGDQAAQERAKAEKEHLLAKSRDYSRLAIDRYSEIVQKYKDYERTDEVLYFLGQNLMEAGEERKALVAYKRLIDRYQKSKFYPDALLAFGEYYFNSSKAKRDLIEKALSYYKQAASFPENQVYAFALYKQGWCYFNLSDYQRAMDMFKAVVLYGEYAGASAVEKDAGKSGKSTLVREARNDFVRAYARYGSPQEAKTEFAKVASKHDDQFLMLKQLANLYYEDGKDREAALTYNTLIRERPLSPEAPGFQGKIVDCVLRAGNKKMTVDQVRRLVKIMGDVEKSGNIKDDKDKKALAEARALSERTLSNLAVNWHNEAKKTRDDETFLHSSEVYSDYLVLFPENPKAYDLRFFWAELLNDSLLKFDRAAEEYTRVVLSDVKRIEGEKDAQGHVKPGKPGKWLSSAAYNAVLAHDEVVKKAEASGEIKPPTSSDLSKKFTIPAQKKALLEACDRYLKYVVNGSRRVEIAFKAANLYYRYNYFDEAVTRFSDIALHHPDYKFENGDRAGEIAANLVIDSYNLLGDWSKVNEWARKFFNEPKLATGHFRDELSKYIEQSSFKLISQLEAKKEYARAAESYLTFVTEFPRSDIADKALYNASVDLLNAKMLERAMQTRDRLMRGYPKSEFVPACIYANGEGHEAIGDFEESARAYEAYVSGYEGTLARADTARTPKGKSSKKRRRHQRQVEVPVHTPGPTQAWDQGKAQIALINSGVFRDGLGQYRQALRDRERFLELWPDAKDSDAVSLSIADLHERNGAYAKALRQFEDYERANNKNPSKVLMAEGRMAAIYERRTHRPRDAQKTYQRMLSFYERLPRRVRDSLDNTALDAVARAQYASAEDDYDSYVAIRLRWGKLPHPEKDFKQGLKDKARGLEAVQKLYTQTVAFKSAEPAICALSQIGRAYDNFANSLVNAPMPHGATPELQDALRDELSHQAQPVKDKAAEAFAHAVQKSRELDIFNRCYADSLKFLRETYRPDQNPPMLEKVRDLKSIKVESSGADLLTAIQPTSVGAATVAHAAQTIKEPSVSKHPKQDLGTDVTPTEPTRPRAQAETPPTRAEGKKEKNQEPEDVL